MNPNRGIGRSGASLIIAMLINIHTHRREERPAIRSILNLRDGQLPTSGQLASAGIHPWEVDETSTLKLPQLRQLLETKNIIALGEIGLDKTRGATMREQSKIFEQQICIANELRKPIIIHCVKAFDELLALKREMQTAAIIHGFRGKPQQMRSLCKAGFFISFGEKFNEETMREMPIDQLFLETDDSKADIRTIYRRAAALKAMAESTLEAKIEANFRKVFGETTFP